MAKLFLSYKSEDRLKVSALRDWLIEIGHRDEEIFWDQVSLGPTDDFYRQFAFKIPRSDAMIVFLSEAARASDWCHAERAAAHTHDVPVIVVVIDDATQIDDLKDPTLQIRQIVDLRREPRDARLSTSYNGQEGAFDFNAQQLEQIRVALDALGLQPNSFGWKPRERMPIPYPGFEPLTELDAKLFFGRDYEIDDALARLRRSSEMPARLFMIEAPSGAGKSSFLRAGLWPRLIRNPGVVPLGMLRATEGAITGRSGLAASLASAGGGDTKGALEAKLTQASEADAIAAFRAALDEALARHVDRNSVGAPLFVIGLDQAEEFSGDGDLAIRAEETSRFRVLLSSLFSAPIEGARLLALAAIRDDLTAPFHEALADIPGDALMTFPLRRMPESRYEQVIRRPGEEIQPLGRRREAFGADCVDALLRDAHGEDERDDALPLLALKLEKLYLGYADPDPATGFPRREVSAADYRMMMENGGPVQDRLREAFRETGRTEAEGLKALEALVIPEMATWDALSSRAKRKVAREAALFADPQRAAHEDLAAALVRARLFTHGADAEGEGATLEVTHEALLRAPPFDAWMAKHERALLLETDVRREAKTWAASGLERDLARRSDRLREAQKLAEAPGFGAFERDTADYLAACAAQEARERDRERRLIQRGFVEPTRQLAKVRPDAALRRMAAAAVLSGDLDFKLEHDTAEPNRNALWRAGASAHADPARLALRGHTGGVRMCVFSPDGARLLTGSSDKTARLWDAGSGAELARLAHDGPVTSVAFSRDGARLLTGSSDKTARLWDAGSGAELARLAHDGPVTSVAFSRDGARLLTGSSDKTARLWDAGSGAELARLAHDGPVTSVAFSRDGARLLTGSEDNTARLWDAGAGAELARLDHDGTVYSVAFSRDGARLLTGSSDKTARLWDAGSGAELARLAHNGPVTSVAFSRDGARLLTGSDDKTARLWDAGSGAELARLAHDGTVNSVAFSRDGARLLTGSDDKTARLWDAGSGAELARFAHDGWVTSVALSRDGARLLTGSFDKTARLWDAGSGAELARLAHDGTVNSVAFSRDGARLLTGSFDKTARLWDAGSGAELARLAHDAWVWSVAFSRDGARLLTGSSDKTARLWDAGSGAELARLAHDGSVRSVAFSRDGARLLTGSSDQTARLWDAGSGAELARFAHDGTVNSVAFSRDGARLLTGSSDKTARLWDAGSGAELARLAHDGTVYSVAFSRDGARLLTGSDDETARLWDAGSGAELARLAHDGTVRSVAFSRDGARLLTGSSDKTARLWDAGSGAELARLAHDAPVTSAAFSRDGARLLTGSGDETARLWDAGSGAELARLAHDGTVYSVAFSRDGARLLTGSDDETARLWDAGSGAELARFAHDGWVTSVAFSRDGTRLLTGSPHGTARLWDAERWRVVAEEPGVMLAAALDCGIGQRSASEASDLLMQDAPHDLHAAMVEALQDKAAEGKDGAEAEAARRAVAEKVAEVSRILRAPMDPRCYLAPSQRDLEGARLKREAEAKKAREAEEASRAAAATAEVDVAEGAADTAETPQAPSDDAPAGPAPDPVDLAAAKADQTGSRPTRPLFVLLRYVFAAIFALALLAAYLLRR